MAVGFLDADCFYVSAERVRDPWLAGVPVGVLGNHGACVIARSYEMKAAGVRVGEPVWDAVKRCPEGVYRKRDFRWYEVLSRSILDVIQGVSRTVEYHSIDEMFYAPPPGPRPTTRTAAGLRDGVLEKTKLPVTSAIARTRTLAKLFADAAKPFGALAVLDPDEERDRLADLPVTEIAGIAGRRAARLAPYGVRSCLDLARMRRSLVRQLLTITGERLWAELNGEPCLPLQTSKPPQRAIGRGGGITPTDDAGLVYAWAVRHLERLIEELEYHRARAGRLTVWLSYRDGPAGLGEASFDTVTDRFDVLLEGVRQGLREAWRPGERVHRVDLQATHLRGTGPVQRGLFDPPPGRWQEVAQVKREINERLGRFTIRSGATLPLKEFYRDSAHGFDICDIRGKLCF